MFVVILLMTIACLVPLKGSAADSICMGDIPPSNMVIVQTTNDPVCGTPCGGRQLQKLTGEIMVICAGQPIPAGYRLGAVLSTPKCDCIGTFDNAYEITRLEEKERGPEEAPSERPTLRFNESPSQPKPTPSP